MRVCDGADPDLADARAMSIAGSLTLMRAYPMVASIGHVVANVRSCLQRAQTWTLESATKAGFVSMLDRLVENEWPGVSHDFREARFLHNVRIAAREGRVGSLNWWRTKYLPDGPDVAAAILHIAAFKDHMDVLKWLHEADGIVQSISAIKSPVNCSSLETARWMQEHWPHVKLDIRLEKAGAQGDLEFLKWVTAQGYKDGMYDRAIESAAAAGHLEVVQYLVRQEPVEYLESALVRAARNGHLDVVKWLLEEYEGTAIDLEDAVREEWNLVENGRFDVIKWLAEDCECLSGMLKDEWIISTMTEAAACANMEILEYLYARRPPQINFGILHAGVYSGSIEVLNWLHARGITSPYDILTIAVATGKIQVVQWVHEHFANLVSTTEAMDCAGRQSLEIVQFLHDNRPEGCTAKAMNKSASHGKLEIVKFLHENRSEGCTWTAMAKAARNGHLAVVKFLSQNRSEGNVSIAMNAAASFGHLQVVQWLLETCPDECDPQKAIIGAASSGHRDVVAYLASQFEPSFEMYYVKGAVQRGHFDMLQWVLQHGAGSLDFNAQRDFHVHEIMFQPSYSGWEIENDDDEERGSSLLF